VSDLIRPRVYKVREASLERSAIHITLEDGSIAFTQDVMGHVTGAFFEGDGEILLMPPDEVERRSMGLFTGWRSWRNGLSRHTSDSTMRQLPNCGPILELLTTRRSRRTLGGDSP